VQEEDAYGLTGLGSDDRRGPGVVEMMVLGIKYLSSARL
jgi:hypothetical protein